MAERRVDNPIRRNAEDQFARVDTRSQLRFGEQSIVCGVIKFENSVEGFLIFCKASEYGRTAVRKLGWDEPMRIPLVDYINRKQNYLPPRRLSSKRRTPIMAGTPPRMSICSGATLLNMALLFGRNAH